MDHAEYPRMLYKAHEKPVVVHSAEDEKRAGVEWNRTPVNGSKHVDRGDGVVHPYTGKEIIESSLTKEVAMGKDAKPADATKEMGADEDKGANQQKGTKQ